MLGFILLLSTINQHAKNAKRNANSIDCLAPTTQRNREKIKQCDQITFLESEKKQPMKVLDEGRHDPSPCNYRGFRG